MNNFTARNELAWIWEKTDVALTWGAEENRETSMRMVGVSVEMRNGDLVCCV